MLSTDYVITLNPGEQWLMFDSLRELVSFHIIFQAQHISFQTSKVNVEKSHSCLDSHLFRFVLLLLSSNLIVQPPLFKMIIICFC